MDLDPSSLTEPRPHITTGSILLDRAIGGPRNHHGIIPCPGYPLGGIINLYGHESSGKTTLALTAAAQVAARGGATLFVDWENEVDLTYAERLGVPVSDPNLFMLYQPETLEQGLRVAIAALELGIKLIVFDSVGAGIPEDVANQALKDKGNQTRIGLVASKWSTILPQLKSAAHRKNAVILCLSQLRKNIGAMAYGPQDTVQGGEALKFFSSIRIRLRKTNVETGKVFDDSQGAMIDKPIAIKVKAKFDKCKVAATQGSEVDFHIRLGEGVDNIRAAIDILEFHGFIKKGGAWYSWTLPNGEEVRGQGSEKFRINICENPLFYNTLITTAQELLHKAPFSEAETPAPDTSAALRSYSGMGATDLTTVTDNIPDEDEDDDFIVESESDNMTYQDEI